MIPVALLAGAALGGAQMAYGAAQKKKADASARNNVMPEYKIPQTEQQALALEESRAGQGISDAQREVLRSNADRSLGTTIDAILRGGGNPNGIGNAAAGAQQQLNQMAVYEDKARIENLARLQAARARMSANQDKAYQINQYAPWANRAQALAQQQAGAQNMMMAGLNTLGQGALGALGTIGASGKPIKSTPYMPTTPAAPYMPTQGISYNGQSFDPMNENIDNTPTWYGAAYG
jgi:hypothetical protein